MAEGEEVIPGKKYIPENPKIQNFFWKIGENKLTPHQSHLLCFWGYFYISALIRINSTCTSDPPLGDPGLNSYRSTKIPGRRSLQHKPRWYGTIKIPPCTVALRPNIDHKFCSPSHQSDVYIWVKYSRKRLKLYPSINQLALFELFLFNTRNHWHPLPHHRSR